MAVSRLVVLLLLGCIAPRGFCAAAISQPQTPGGSEQPDGIATPDPIGGFSHDFGLGWQPFADARPALTGHHKGLPELTKRGCLANGTNFCFSNDINYCSSCGTCCSASSSNGKWCCPSDGICCGDACCGSGQTCKNGQCFLPVVTVTTESTVTTTATQKVTEVTTVLKVVIVQAISSSIYESTVTDNSGTQTNWAYVTVTTTANKRDVPSSQRNAQGEDASGTDDELRGLPNTLTPAPAAFRRRRFSNRRREATASDLSATAVTTTAKSVVTVTAIVTHYVATTTTTLTTSTQLSIVHQTNTKVVSAVATVEATSTLTFTSSEPTTSTSIVVATVIESPSLTASQSSQSSSTVVPVLVTGSADSVSSHAKLSSSAIAGIAVGSTAVTILAGLLAFLAIRRHRRKKSRAIENADPYLGSGAVQHNYSGPPPPAAAGYGRGKISMQQDGRGLPPIPFFSKLYDSAAQTATTNTAHTTALSTPQHEHHSSMSSTSSAEPRSGGSLAFKLSDPAAATAAAAASAAAATAGAKNNQHLRSGSGATTGTASSATAIDSSGRNSLNCARKLAAGAQHQRDLSMGSETTTQTLAHLGGAYGSSPAELPAQPPLPAVRSAPSTPWIAAAAAPSDDNDDTDRETSGWRSGFRRSRTNTVTQGGGFFYRDY